LTRIQGSRTLLRKNSFFAEDVKAAALFEAAAFLKFDNTGCIKN